MADAPHAAVAVDDATWVTLDRDFARFFGLRWRTPRSEQPGRSGLSDLARHRVRRCESCEWDEYREHSTPVSPVSRKRAKKRPPKSAHSSRPTPKRDTAGQATLDTVLGDLEHSLEPTLSSEDPFDAEIFLAELIGSMRGIEDTDPGAPVDTVDAVIDGLALRRTRAAVAALVALAQIAPAESSRARAEHRLDELPLRNMARPAWDDAIAAWVPGRVRGIADAYGDQATLVIEFSGLGRAHALVALVDFSHLGVWCPDVFFVDDVVALRVALSTQAANEEGSRLFRLDLEAARFLIDRGLEATAMTRDPHLGESFDDMHALALARVRLLPAAGAATATATATPEVRAMLTAAGLHTPSALGDLAVAGQSDREVIVQRFLASAPAAALIGAAPDTIDFLAHALVDFGCDYDDGRPLRVSPIKLANFLQRWLPRKVSLDVADKAAVPAVIDAWVDFAVGESSLSPVAVRALRAQMPDVLADFKVAYDDPANFGPARALVEGIGKVASLDELQTVMAGRVAEHNAQLATGWTYELRVDIVGAKPPIWRRLELPATTTLAQLHHVLQIAFGWQDGHLHEFTVGRTHYGVPDAGLMRPRHDEGRANLSQLLERPGEHLDYLYDFGDSWAHRVVLERIDFNSSTVAVCTGGRRAGPVEDSGGIWGYQHLCAALADPTHPDHAERAEWAGYAPGAVAFDPATFDPATVTAALVHLPLETAS